MKPIPVLGIPYYNRPDLLARCVASIDYPVEKLVLVLQGPEGLRAELDALRGEPGIIPAGVKETVVLRHPNAGVAGAWNEIIKLFPAPWWLIANNDIEFAPGDLAKTSVTLDPNNLDMIYGNHGASWFAITARGVAAAGLFDENIYPAYLEDCDMSRRFDLLGLRQGNVPEVHSIHGDAARGISGSTTINSDPKLSAQNARTHGGNFDYYRRKWGGINEQEVYPTPFNDPQWPVWAWRFDPAHRAEQIWPA